MAVKGCRPGGAAHPDRHSRPGPRSAFAFLPWLLLGLGSLSNVVKGETPNPWVGAVGLIVFNSLYVYVVFRAFVPAARAAPTTRVALAAMAAVTFTLAIGYGGPWLAFFPLLSLAVGTVLRGRQLAWTVGLLTALAAATAAWRDADPSSAVTTGYGTLLSGMVTAAILALSEKVVELRETREELALAAVDRERLRFARDLHDLLGHSLSVIVVKSEAARRLAPQDPEGSLRQVADIETVGRQALTEIREAVTGYRASGLTAELDRARDALSSAGIEPVVRRSGPPPAPVTGALLAWVVREAVTNAVRHSGATTCRIDLAGTADESVLTVTDDGRGEGARPHGPGSLLLEEPGEEPRGNGLRGDGLHGDGPRGNGLRGLGERLAQAGGSLESGPRDGGGFRVVARLPADASARAVL